MKDILNKLYASGKVTRIISGDLSGVISTGSFQNFRPGFKDEILIEDCTLTEDEIRTLKLGLYEANFTLFKECERQAIIERIHREQQNIRTYPHPNGMIVPSVTSVRDWDIDMFIDPVSLSQYASQSTIVHAKVAHFIETKQWVSAKEIDSVWPDIVIVTQGHLKLEVDTGSFPGFLEKYPIIEMKNGTPVFLEDSAGLPDFIGIPKGWKEALEIPTIFDCKRTPDKVKDGIQVSAYCHATGLKQGIIVPINNKTEQGWSKPHIYDEKSLNGYFNIYKQKRENFRKRYGL